MKRIAFSALLALLGLTLYAQDFTVPPNYKLEKESDYAQYEQDVVRCVDWLLATPVDEQPAKRKQANAFLLQWLTGSPTVSIEINPQIVTFMEGSPEYLMIFMGGWAKHALETKDYSNKAAGSLAGIESVLAFYAKNQGVLKKDKNLEKYVKMKEKGTLQAYVEKNA